LSSHDALKAVIDNAYEARAQLTPRNDAEELRTAVESVIELLNDGALRVAQPDGGGGTSTNGSRKPCCYRFRINDNEAMPAGGFELL